VLGVLLGPAYEAVQDAEVDALILVEVGRVESRGLAGDLCERVRGPHTCLLAGIT
jgi:hypothetical protein